MLKGKHQQSNSKQRNFYPPKTEKSVGHQPFRRPMAATAVQLRHYTLSGAGRGAVRLVV